MAVYKGNNNGGKKGGGGGRPRPDFTPSSRRVVPSLRLHRGPRKDHRPRERRRAVLPASCKFNIDIASLKAGWVDFQAQGESSIVGDDRDDPPAGAGERDGPKWGVEVPIAMPYATVFDDVEIIAVPPCLIKTTTGLLLEAFGSLWDAYHDDENHKDSDVACCEVAGWEAVSKAGGKKYFRPRFKIIGFVKGLEDQFAGKLTSDDD